MTYHRMMATLAQCEFVMEKSLLVSEMNLKEQENYEKLSRDIGKQFRLPSLFALPECFFNTITSCFIGGWGWGGGERYSL